MTIHISSHPLILHKVTLLRDVATERGKFRQVMSEISAMLTYEATRGLPLTTRSVTTPLTRMTRSSWCPSRLALVPILRAGLGMIQGVWQVIPHAEVWHLGFRRDEETLAPQFYYQQIPDEPRVDCCLVLDPMLATGGSAAAALSLLKARHTGAIRYVCIVAAPEGIRAVSQAHPDVPLTIAAVDERLTDDGDDVPNGYIWPGLGDAGDRQFGTA